MQSPAPREKMTHIDRGATSDSLFITMSAEALTEFSATCLSFEIIQTWMRSLCRTGEMDVALFKALMCEIQAVRADVGQVKQQNDRIILKLNSLGLGEPLNVVEANCQSQDKALSTYNDSQLSLAAGRRCARYGPVCFLVCSKIKNHKNCQKKQEINVFSAMQTTWRVWQLRETSGRLE
jgi:hypothetical protein